MNKRAWFVVVAALLAGCEHKAEQTSRTSNAEFKIERLFVYDGCTVYRFADGYYRYFVKCANARASGASWEENCGKNCTRPVQIDTATEGEP